MSVQIRQDCRSASGVGKCPISYCKLSHIKDGKILSSLSSQHRAFFPWEKSLLEENTNSLLQLLE